MYLKDWRHRIALMGILLSIVACAPLAPKSSGAALDTARRLVDRATLALRAGDLDAAQAGYEVALQNAPLASAIDGLGCVAFLRGEYPTAATLFERAYAQDPGSASALFNLAMVQEVLGREELARQLYERGIELNPRDARGRANYAALLADRSRSNGRSALEARRELLRAQALAKTGLISRNIQTLDESL